MTISSISSSSGFHVSSMTPLHIVHVCLQYQLDTFTESRKSAWKFEPYIGEIIFSEVTYYYHKHISILVQNKACSKK